MFHHAALFVYNRQLVGSIEIVPARELVLLALMTRRKADSDSRRVRYTLGHGAHDQDDKARRHCDRHFRFDG